jgi:porphobilinogen synthase
MKTELYDVSEKVQPFARLHRLRRLESLRSLLRETRLSSLDFMYPIFVDHRLSKPEPLDSMPGINRLSLADLKEEIAEVLGLKIPAVLVFGLPKSKNALGSEAYATDSVVQQAVRTIKKVAPQLVVATDVCLCSYTDHGHCGVVRDGKVDNDETLQLLAKIAVGHVEAGADIVAPSAMMDGQVAAIRGALDTRGFSEAMVMSYSAKFASAFYGPFREAAESTPLWGDRRSYQMDPPNRREAMREIESDIEEGADIVMVKPALSYLDLIREARDRFQQPLAAYNVSGEYSMIKAAGEKGWLDDRRVAMEVLTAIKRAGANIVITYFAKDASKWLEESK